ncbi:unnamed protein product [Leptidea sinapis]|uniref:DNA replication factor Dna2 N-terminal domain-containing protein n=1 Tax=Leptidea sinapis TaxID=189913 RepID=A0A5E4QQ49_9NEOP|nr:unnamed protein product [Leptidea sinapis]
MQTYKKPSLKPSQKAKWNGHIDKVLDIEENICCPKLGLKGKIDATLQVTIHEKGGKSSEVVALELKSGRASGSAEHRGQLILYGMMMSLQRNEDPSMASQRGLLLYLKDQIDLREVKCGYPERRDLVMLRNELVQHLAAGPRDTNSEELVDIEDSSKLIQQTLPEPVHHEGACSKCPYLTICSIHLWHTNDVTVSQSHPLAKLRELALGHVTSQHIDYFLHWTSLIKLEERRNMSASKRGTCAANLKIKSVVPLGDRYSHIFERPSVDLCEYSLKSPQAGEFSIVSLDERPWIAAGVISSADHKEIHILLESTRYHIDTYESYATSVQNLTNLGEAPSFTEKLPREVGRLGSKLMRSLNIEQQRAVLRALAANDYALLQGLPGTGRADTNVGRSQTTCSSDRTHALCGYQVHCE